MRLELCLNSTVRHIITTALGLSFVRHAEACSRLAHYVFAAPSTLRQPLAVRTQFTNNDLSTYRKLTIYCLKVSSCTRFTFSTKGEHALCKLILLTYFSVL